MRQNEKKFLNSLLPGLFLLMSMWLIKGVELISDTSLAYFGLKPGSLFGLIGIFTMPFLHGSVGHLLSNTLPFMVLSTIIFSFYPKVTTQLFPWLFVATGFWTWLFARPYYHVGASGLIYGMASFIFFSGVLKRERASIALALLVMFLYSSTMLSGLVPSDKNLSWEGHLAGAVAGMVYAFIARNEDKHGQKYVLENHVVTHQQDEDKPLIINYIYLPKQQNADKIPSNEEL